MAVIAQFCENMLQRTVLTVKQEAEEQAYN